MSDLTVIKNKKLTFHFGKYFKHTFTDVKEKDPCYLMSLLREHEAKQSTLSNYKTSRKTLTLLNEIATLSLDADFLKRYYAEFKMPFGIHKEKLLSSLSVKQLQQVKTFLRCLDKMNNDLYRATVYHCSLSAIDAQNKSLSAIDAQNKNLSVTHNLPDLKSDV
jgi:hypothetical protein